VIFDSATHTIEHVPNQRVADEQCNYQTRAKTVKKAGTNRGWHLKRHHQQVRAMHKHPSPEHRSAFNKRKRVRAANKAKYDLKAKLLHKHAHALMVKTR
jgi:hypothetical protein